MNLLSKEYSQSIHNFLKLQLDGVIGKCCNKARLCLQNQSNRLTYNSNRWANWGRGLQQQEPQWGPTLHRQPRVGGRRRSGPRSASKQLRPLRTLRRQRCNRKWVMSLRVGFAESRDDPDPASRQSQVEPSWTSCEWNAFLSVIFRTEITL